MASIETKSLDRPDASRAPEKTVVSVVHLGDATVARLTVHGPRRLGGWVVGDEPFVALEFESKTAETYAKG